ncbi:MAG: OmpA family protein [Cyanothece sp. SIO1E1]|nr:OmpA family protein [Cyanothece sp. SIO1E1]
MGNRVFLTSYLVFAMLVTSIASGLSSCTKPSQPSISNHQPAEAVRFSHQKEVALKALADPFKGYSTLQGSNLKEALVKRGITLEYADESNQYVRAAALGQGNADIIATRLEKVLRHRPEGKVVALMNQIEAGNKPRVDVVVASNQLLKSNPKIVEKFVTAYYSQIDTAPATTTEEIQVFNAATAKDWITAGKLEQKMEAIAEKLAKQGQLEDVPENFDDLFTIAYISTAEQKIRDRSQVLGEIQFEKGAIALTSQAKQRLDDLAFQIKAVSPSQATVEVQGHTSQTGKATANQDISQKRAQAVVDYLKSQNLDHEFSAKGFGFSQPLPNTDPADAVNQRTVVRLVKIDL